MTISEQFFFFNWQERQKDPFENPRSVARNMMKDQLTLLSLLASQYEKNCECPDHIGPHAVYLSRRHLLGNYKIFIDHLDSMVLLPKDVKLINIFLDVLKSEMDRQYTLNNDIYIGKIK